MGRLTELGDLLAVLRPGRTAAAEITLFESHGMAIEDLYYGRWVLDAALGNTNLSMIVS